jgi:hypothetical protein
MGWGQPLMYGSGVCNWVSLGWVLTKRRIGDVGGQGTGQDRVPGGEPTCQPQNAPLCTNVRLRGHSWLVLVLSLLARLHAPLC